MRYDWTGSASLGALGTLAAMASVWPSIAWCEGRLNSGMGPEITLFVRMLLFLVAAMIVGVVALRVWRRSGSDSVLAVGVISIFLLSCLWMPSSEVAFRAGFVRWCERSCSVSIPMPVIPALDEPTPDWWPTEGIGAALGQNLARERWPSQMTAMRPDEIRVYGTQGYILAWTSGYRLRLLYIGAIGTDPPAGLRNHMVHWEGVCPGRAAGIVLPH